MTADCFDKIKEDGPPREPPSAKFAFYFIEI